MAGCVISNGFANSVTVASPLARRARIARRVGSARAEKVASRSAFISYTLYKLFLIVKLICRRLPYLQIRLGRKRVRPSATCAHELAGRAGIVADRSFPLLG